MKILCITGASQPLLRTLEGLLAHAGAKPARALDSGAVRDIHAWHERVIDASLASGDSPRTPIHPGRLWERLAAELFIANLDCPVWTWSSVQSLWLLEFWHTFDPQIYFLLPVLTPEDFVALRIGATDPLPAVDELLREWQATHERMLRFHLRHPERSLLISAGDIERAPARLVQTCIEHWGVGLDAAPELPSPEPSPLNPLVRFIAQDACRGWPEIASLQESLEAAMLPLGEGAARSPAAQSPAELWSLALAYRDITARADACASLQCEHARLQDEHALLARSRDDLQRSSEQQRQRLAVLEPLEKQLKDSKALIADLEKERESLNARMAETQKQLAEASERATTLTKTRDDLQRSTEQQRQRLAVLEPLETQVKEFQEENELLLAQLHQVQEELESTFLSQQDTAKQLEKVTGERNAGRNTIEEKAARIAALEQELKALTSRIAETQKQLAEASERATTLTKSRDELQRSAEQQRQRLAVLEPLEKQLKDSKARIADLEKERESLNARMAETQKQLAEASERTTTLTKTRDDLQRGTEQQRQRLAVLEPLEAQLKEIQEENELLLAQLHQVQEELEQIFLQHQESQRKIEDQESRLQRVLRHNPRLVDAPSVDVGVEGNGDGEMLVWRFHDVLAGGRCLSELTIASRLHHDSAALILRRDPSGGSPLRRWPNRAAESELHIALNEGGAQDLFSAEETIDALATSDWDLLIGLIRVMNEQLRQPQALPPEARSLATHGMLAALQRLGERLQARAAVLRFDQVELEREQVNPDYEHIWIQLFNISLGDHRWPQFGFRISCAHVSPMQFGTHPKLEIPQADGERVLEHWFPESQDDFGPKLELRFALPETIDIQVLERISRPDQVFLNALISQLPSMLEELERGGTRLRRPWADWHELAAQVLRIYRQHCPAAGAPPSTVPPAPNDPQDAEAAVEEPPTPDTVDAMLGESMVSSVTTPAEPPPPVPSRDTVLRFWT